MDEYRVELNRRGLRDLERLDSQTGPSVLRAIESLASEPRPAQSRKLVGSYDSYRLRVGNYRILYEVDDSNSVVIVFAVGHRRDVYR